MTEVTHAPEAYLVGPDGETPLGITVEAWKIDPHYEVIRSDGAWEPDRGWHLTHHGHTHVWDDHQQVTNAHSERRHVPCDGSCGGVCEGEGYYRYVWVCEVDGTDVAPRLRPGPSERHIHTNTTVEVDVVGNALPPEVTGASVYFRDSGGRLCAMALPHVMRRGDVLMQRDHLDAATYSGEMNP